ncbi:MAG TPA: hypothetical protein PK829_05715 [Promineifilum sp.]|mgnify:CR=1 FL=1|nr:hypothetical protein [Promineifilum sp.]
MNKKHLCAALAVLLVGGASIGCGNAPDENAALATTEATAVAVAPTKPPPIIAANTAAPAPTSAEVAPPTPTAQPTMEITAAPTAAPTDVPPTPVPPTAVPPTAVPATVAPPAPPAPTAIPPTAVPPTAAPPPSSPGSINGLSASNFAIQDRAQLTVNGDIWFEFHVANSTNSDVPFDALGVMPKKDGVDRPQWYQHSWGGNNDVIPPDGLSWDDHINLPEAGNYTLRLVICFDGPACQAQNGTWHTLSQEIPVTIR